MTNSKQIAGLIGPTLIVLTISEAINAHIWANNIPAAIHFNGALLFVAGLSIVRAHNLWSRGWPVLVTLVGWIAMLLGLFRMFAPELMLQVVQNNSYSAGILAEEIIICIVGIILTFKAYRGEAV